MRKGSFILESSITALLLGCTLFFSCKKKTFDDALPVLSLESAVMSNLDSVTLTGNITSQGADAIEYAGFAYNEHPSFTLTSNQVLVQGSGSGRFTCTVHALHDSTYYFKAFAANGFGYRASNIIKYTVPAPAPAYAPCTLTNNYMNDGGLGFPVTAYGSAASPQFGGYTVTLYGSSEDIAISFAYKPVNGVYTTFSNSTATLGPGQAIISISNFNQYIVNSGGKVYVAIDSTGTTTLSTCGVYYNNGVSNVTLYGKASF